jgi:hypothetical protein
MLHRRNITEDGILQTEELLQLFDQALHCVQKVLHSKVQISAHSGLRGSEEMQTELELRPYQHLRHVSFERCKWGFGVQKSSSSGCHHLLWSPFTRKCDVSLVRFEVFMAVTMKNGVFWGVRPCGSCKNQRFGGT